MAPTPEDLAGAVKVLRDEARHFDTDGSAASLTRVADWIDAQGWQDIASAPRDGTKFDALNIHGERVTDVWWRPNSFVHWGTDQWGDSGIRCVDIPLKHWRRLPSPPEASDAP